MCSASVVGLAQAVDETCVSASSTCSGLLQNVDGLHVVFVNTLRHIQTGYSLKLSFLKKFYVFLEGKEKGRETSLCDCLLWPPLVGTWSTTQASALTGNQTSNPLGPQASAQSTEPHQPGLKLSCFTLTVAVRVPGVHTAASEQCWPPPGPGGGGRMVCGGRGAEVLELAWPAGTPTSLPSPRCRVWGYSL